MNVRTLLILVSLLGLIGGCIPEPKGKSQPTKLEVCEQFAQRAYEYDRRQYKAVVWPNIENENTLVILEAQYQSKLEGEQTAFRSLVGQIEKRYKTRRNAYEDFVVPCMVGSSPNIDFPSSITINQPDL